MVLDLMEDAYLYFLPSRFGSLALIHISLFFFLIEKIRFGICNEDKVTPVSEFIAKVMILSVNVFVCT